MLKKIDLGASEIEYIETFNALVDAVNALVYEHDKDSDWYDGRTRAENVQDRMIGCTTLDIPKSYKNNQLTLATLDYSKKLEKENSDLKDELERTRKALDIALCSLQDIAESNGDFIIGASTPLDEHEYADMMLKEIKRQMKIKTAPEQKDVK